MGIKLSDVDKNFALETLTDLKDIKFYDIKSNPFKIYGADKATFERKGLWRIPEALANECNLIWGANCPAGFRVRFKSDSEYVAIKVKFANQPEVVNVLSQSCDLYVDYENGSRFAGRFSPTNALSDGYEAVIHFGTREERSFTLNLLTYEMVKDVYIGLQSDATVSEGMQYNNHKPIVYYGSSITQGGRASRPGNTYQSIICRRTNTDYVNLGFSGRAKAEIPVMEYISNLDMSIFVYDYDHNAPSLDYLKETHERGYKIVREKNPDLPIVLISKPDFENRESTNHEHFKNVIRRTVVMQTYINAINSGDKNVYFIDGAQFFNVDEGDCCVCDGCHPTDYGFVRMADIIGNQIKAIQRKMR